MHSDIQVLEERNEKIQKKGKSPEKSNRFFPCLIQSSNKQQKARCPRASAGHSSP
jgi:hypothetical protein